MGILATALERRAVEQSGVTKPASWLVNFFGGGRSKAGITVTEANALQISTVWGCVRAISEDCARLPIRVFSETADGTKVLLRKHPLWRILNQRPNPRSNALVVRETHYAHSIVWGNSFSEIERDGAGRPLALWPLRPDRMRVDITDRDEMVFIYTNRSGREVRLRSDQVFHVPGLGFDGLVGYSVVAMARESFGLTAAAEQFGGSFFGNGAKPSGILTHPKTLKEPAIKNLRISFSEKYAGNDNHQSPMVLEEDMKWTPLSIPPEDAQFLETRAFQVAEICRWFRMKPHKVADLSRATFSNIEQQDLEYVGDCLMGWMTRFEQEVWAKLLLPSEQESTKAEHVVAGLLRSDIKSRYEAHAIGRQWGWRSPNDVLRLESESPITTGGGDDYLTPVNMMPSDLARGYFSKGPAPKPGEPPANPKDPIPPTDEKRTTADDLARFHIPVLADVVRRFRRIEHEKAERAEARGELASWSATFFAEHRAHVRSALASTVEAVGAMVEAWQGRPGAEGWRARVLDKMAAQQVRRSADLVNVSGVAGLSPDLSTEDAQVLAHVLGCGIKEAWNIEDKP